MFMMFQSEASAGMRYFFYFFNFLTSLGSASLVRESYRDSSLSQLVPHRISLAPPLWKRWAHSGRREKKSLLFDLNKLFDILFKKTKQKQKQKLICFPAES